MIHPTVQRLLFACPFLVDRVDGDYLDLATVTFGQVAGLLRRRALSSAEEKRVFAYFNELAEHGSADDLDILGTGAIEMFNDDATSQQLARAALSGAALMMLEDFRRSWGQPDYGQTKR